MNSLYPRTVALCVLFILLNLAASAPVRASDPCNFADGSSAFGWNQVMSCYSSVPFNQADLYNAVDFLAVARERSDLRDVYDAQLGWRQSLAVLRTQVFSSDFAMQLAIVGNHKEFNNPHWRYQRPRCYTDSLAPFMPFDFGSTVVATKGKKPGRAQIIFIEAAPFLPNLYQDFTGIDARLYVGMRVVSINGVEPLEYFRNYGRNVYRVDTNDGEQLNEVLQNAAYSVRSSTSHDVPPPQADDTYVLENKQGRRVTVTMPWVFAPRAAFGLFQGQLPVSTAMFQQSCLTRSSAAILAGVGLLQASTADGQSGDQGRTDEVFLELRQKREMAQRLRKVHGGNNSSGYFEVPPGLRGQGLEVVVPKADGAVAYALSDRATILRLDDFGQDWKQEVIAATNHACECTDTLIIDMRNNAGGSIKSIDWLTTHLFPERTAPQQYSLTGRFLRGNIGRDELVDRATVYSNSFEPGSCSLGYEAACFVDPLDGQPLPDWSQGATNEVRGGASISLNRRSAFRNFDSAYQPGQDPIACPGKFKGSTLIVLSNGTGLSAGYFFPELIRDQATIVTAGGRIGEPLVTGIARGGAVRGLNYEAYLEQYFIKYVFGPAADPLPFIVRNVESYMESPGVYTSDLATLHANKVSYGDIQIEVWGDSPETDLYVYRKVLNAVRSNK